ncbi:hypothetical protein EDB92DRAFT_1898042, partial [Lactarius akahatsu]
MSSFEKVVKNACKPKPTRPSQRLGLAPHFLHARQLIPPLSGQYVDPIIAATWSENGAIHDVCKARF